MKLRKSIQKELLKGKSANKIQGQLMGQFDRGQKTIMTWITTSDSNLRLDEGKAILCEGLKVSEKELFE